MADRDALRSVVVACGGTGGHVYPAIAIARSLMARNPGVAISFVGRADSYESQVLQREGARLGVAAFAQPLLALRQAAHRNRLIRSGPPAGPRGRAWIRWCGRAAR